MLLPYAHLTIYHYIYAADLYDVLLVPLAESLRDYVVANVHKLPFRVRTVLNPDTIFLVKES